MLIIPFLSTWFRIVVLYGMSLTSCLLTLFLFHTFSYLALGHAIVHALVMPTIVYWFLHNLSYGQEREAFVMACIISLHPGYFINASMSFATCGMSASFLLFLILAINTFHFSWCEFPRHVIEATLLYAPEMGFLTMQYDRLIDELGYNEWYARYRTLWLIAIGLAWGGLMTVSLNFVFLGLTLFIIYGFVSSSYQSMIKKMLTILAPAVFILILLYFASPGSFSFKNLQPRFDFDFLYKIPSLIFMPTYIFIQSVNYVFWYSKFMCWFVLALELFFLVGFLGMIWLLVHKNSSVRLVLELFPFMIAFVLGAVLEGNMSLLWIMYPCVTIVAGFFWMELVRPFLSTTTSL